MVGVVGGCSAIEPISAGGDSVIRITEDPISESVGFLQSESVTETIIESVTVMVT